MNAATFRLREMRERAGMTQAQLGALVGITNAAISKFERGKNPSFSRATDIAIALGCTLDELAGIEGKAPEMTTREQLLADVEGHLSVARISHLSSSKPSPMLSGGSIQIPGRRHTEKPMQPFDSCRADRPLTQAARDTPAAGNPADASPAKDGGGEVSADEIAERVIKGPGNCADIRDLLAEREKLVAVALKAYTIVEWVVGEGRALEPPHFDADDTLLEMAASLGVETSFDARLALEQLPEMHGPASASWPKALNAAGYTLTKIEPDEAAIERVAERVKYEYRRYDIKGASENDRGYGPPYNAPWFLIDASRSEPEVNHPGELVGEFATSTAAWQALWRLIARAAHRAVVEEEG